MFDSSKNFVKNVFDIRNTLSESGGRLILGHNPLQVDRRSKLLKILNQWNKHVKVVMGGRHWRVETPSGEVVTTVTNSNVVGPKTAIHVLGSLRDHLIKIKAYEPKRRETASINSGKGNAVVPNKPKSSIPVRSREENQERLRGLLATTVRRFGDKRRSRVQRAIQKTREALKRQ